jgi:hypothetical protein
MLDREALDAEIFAWYTAQKPNLDLADLGDRIAALCLLVRPEAGVTLTREEAAVALGWEARVSAEWGPERTTEEQALVARLEATQ